VVVVARAFAISTTDPHDAARGLGLEVSALAVGEVPVEDEEAGALDESEAGALDAAALVASAAPGFVAAAVFAPSLPDVALLAPFVVVAFVLTVEESGPEQINVTRFPALTNPRRVIALPSTGSVAAAVVFAAASAASPVLSRTVMVFAGASTATISACT